MPRTTDPDKYPDEFLQMLEQALVSPVTIPHASPASLRRYVQAYLKACETKGGDLGDKAKRLQVNTTVNPPAVVIQNRSEGVYAKAVIAALGTSTRDEAESAQSDFARRLAALGD